MLKCMQVFSHGNDGLNDALYICPVDNVFYVHLRIVLLQFVKKIIYIFFLFYETIPKSSHQIDSQSNSNLIFKIIYFVYSNYMTKNYNSQFKHSEGTYN